MDGKTCHTLLVGQGLVGGGPVGGDGSVTSVSGRWGATMPGAENRIKMKESGSSLIDIQLKSYELGTKGEKIYHTLDCDKDKDNKRGKR